MVDILVDESVHSYLTLVNCFFPWCTSYLGVINIYLLTVWCISFTASSPYLTSCLTLAMSYVGGNSLREWQCVPFGGSGQPVSLWMKHETDTRQTYIKLIDWKTSQKKHSQVPETRWLTRKTKNIYIFIYLFVKGIDDLFLQVTNFLGHPSKTCYCSYKTFGSFWSLHLRTYESLLFWVHTQSDASGRCGKHTDLPGFMACTRCSSRVSSSLLTPVLVDIDRQVCGWNQTCQIKYFTGIQYIYIYLCMQVWFPSSCGSDKIQQLAT